MWGLSDGRRQLCRATWDFRRCTERRRLHYSRVPVALALMTIATLLAEHIARSKTFLKQRNNCMATLCLTITERGSRKSAWA